MRITKPISEKNKTNNKVNEKIETPNDPYGSGFRLLQSEKTCAKLKLQEANTNTAPKANEILNRFKNITKPIFVDFINVRIEPPMKR